MAETRENQDVPQVPQVPGEQAADERPHRPTDDREEVYFEGSPALRGEAGRVFVFALIGVICIVLAGASWVSVKDWPKWPGIILIVVGVAVFLIPRLLTKTIHYRVSNYRIDYERGIFGKQIDALELWHVEDISFHQSLLDRIFGVGTITIVSHDETNPQLELSGIPNPQPVFESLKQRVIAVKRQRGVIKMDMG